MKKALIILGGFLVTLVAVALVGPGFVDWSQYRELVTNLARDYTGRELSIEGDISFHILPNPALSLEGLTMKNSEGGVSPTFITLDSLDLNVAFFSLLSREIQIESLTLEGAHIALEVDGEGRKNWIFNENQKNSSNSNFRLDSFKIINSTISYRDAERGIFEEFSGINATLRADSSSGPFVASGALISRGEPVGFDVTSGKIQKARSFPVSVSLTLPGAEEGLSIQGTVVLDGPASAISAEVKAKGSNAQRMVTSLQVLFQKPLEHPVNSARPFEFSTKLIATKARLSLKPIYLKVGETVAEGDILILPEEDVPNVNVTLKVNTVKLENWLDGVKSNSTSEEGDIIPPLFLGAIDINIGALEYKDGIVSRANLKGFYRDNAFEIERFQALLPGGSDIGIMGRFDLKKLNKPGFDGAVRISANNLRGLLTWAGIDLKAVPSGQLASFAMESGLKIEGNTYNLLRARGQLDITRFNGDARIRLGARPNIALNIGLSRFNFDNYFPNRAKSEQPKSWEDIKESYDKAFAPLADFEGSFKIKSQALTIKNVSIQSLDLDASLRRGKLTLKRLTSANTLGIKANITGTVEVGSTFPKLDLVVDLEAGTLASFLKWANIDIKADPFELGVISTKGRIATDLREASLNLVGQGVFGTYTVEGTMGGISSDPDSFDLRASIEHPDHHDLFRRLSLDMPFGGGPAPVNLSMTARGSFTEMAGMVEADILGGNVRIEGQIKDINNTPKGVLNVDFNHADLVKVAEIFHIGLTPSIDNLGSFGLKAKFEGEEIEYGLSDLTAQMGPTKMTGGFKINKRGIRPRVTGNVRFDQLPLDSFIQNSRTGAVEAHTLSGERWSRDHLNMDFVKNWDSNISLEAGDATYGRYKLESPRVHIKSENGILDAPGFRAGLFGGDLDAQITIDATSIPKLIMDLSLKDGNMENVVVAFADVRPVSGRLNLSGHFEGSGNSQFDFIASLGGRGEITARDGAIKGINLTRLSNDIGGFEKLSDLVRVLGNSFRGGETPYSVMTTNFEVQGGLIKTNQMTFIVDGALIDGSGALNLPRWTMEAGANIRLSRDEEAPPIGIRLEGAFDRPDITYQTNQLKAHVGERIAQKLLEATLAQTLSGVLNDNTGAVATEPLGAPLEGEVAPNEEEIKGATIIKGLYDLINARKNSKEGGAKEVGTQKGEEEPECDGPDCPPN